ncbi:MAG: hypothetical protein IPK83_04400 [Planctomycetes bacterium]|nr:hypothetical protein [Planctomycetota bacterium]
MQKAIHFRGYERGQNWVYSGEERARFFLWQSTPHYFFPIFEKSMRIPDHLKANDALCVEFMRCLSPEWAAVREANYGLPLSSRLRPLKMKLKHFALDLPLPLRESLRFLLKGKRRPYVPPAEVLAHLRDRLKSSDALGSIMCADAVFRRLEKMSRYEFENFYTLAILERLSKQRRFDG